MAIILIAFAGSCSNEKSNEQTKELPDRMASEFRNIRKIAVLKQLTDLQTDFNPFFSPDGERIYFTRLLVLSQPDSTDKSFDAEEEYFSMDYKNNRLFILEDKPIMQTVEKIPRDSLPKMVMDDPLFGIHAPGGIYFTAQSKSRLNCLNIYKIIDDSLIQITYGKSASFLEMVSPDERYLVFYYGEKLNTLVVIDLQTGLFYEIPKNSDLQDRCDYYPDFSPDGKYMVFLRSGNLYYKDKSAFGNLWLVEFNENSD